MISLKQHLNRGLKGEKKLMVKNVRQRLPSQGKALRLKGIWYF